MASNAKVLIGLGIGAAIIAALAYSSPAESKIVANQKDPTPPLPPARPGGTGPAPGTSAADAIAAAIAAAQGAAGGGTGNPGLVPPQAGMLSGLLLPNPAPLVQGQRYKARLELSGLQTLGSRDQIKAVFEGMGFSNATVYMEQNELPSGWPGLALANVTNNSRWAEGTWNQSSQTLPTPSEIQNAWTA